MRTRQGSFHARVLAAAFLAMAACVPAGATPPRAGVPEPVDVAWPGTLVLEVDASDIERRIFRVQEEIPVQPGPLVLLYPQWLPGNHAPRGPIDKLAGLRIRGGGVEIAWQRDPLDVHAFHIVVPAGVDRLHLAFEFLSPQERGQGRVMMTADMLNLQWNTVVLYPAGHYARRIEVLPSVLLPPGWGHGTALDPVPGTAGADAGGRVRFAAVSLETLVDSPLFAGRHFRRVALGGGDRPVALDLVADEAKDLAITPEQLDLHRALVTQAQALFGPGHYDHYDFLLALSDRLGGIGLEHHRSSENTQEPGYFTDWVKQAPGRDLLAHEYSHSWNGKFRRPADLDTPNFNVPMQGSLLWVYEGQTQYWGHVLTARAGLWSAEQAREALALVASRYADNRPGFGWRDVQDTTTDPVVAQRRPLPWRSWQMSEEYYSAGQLLWLAVDAKLRELSRERRSLDDFARAFFGIDGKGQAVAPYTFEDVVAALDAVAPFDWATFLRTRLDAHAPPLDGLAASGWKLAYGDQPGAFQKAAEAERKSVDHSASIGLMVSTRNGDIQDVRWDGPAFRAGMSPRGSVVAVNGLAFTPERLADAITAAKDPATGIDLLLRDGERYRSVRLDYHGGLRYPRLERIDGTRDRLSAILAPRR